MTGNLDCRACRQSGEAVRPTDNFLARIDPEVRVTPVGPAWPRSDGSPRQTKTSQSSQRNPLSSALARPRSDSAADRRRFQPPTAAHRQSPSILHRNTHGDQTRGTQPITSHRCRSVMACVIPFHFLLFPSPSLGKTYFHLQR